MIFNYIPFHMFHHKTKYEKIIFLKIYFGYQKMMRKKIYKGK